MKKILIGLTLVAGLAGCAKIEAALTTTVSPQAALVAANSFDAMEAVATGYLQLPTCGKTAVVTCKTTAAVNTIVPAVRSGRAARDQIEALLKASSGAAIPLANYNTLQAVITSLQGIYAQYNIKTS